MSNCQEIIGLKHKIEEIMENLEIVTNDVSPVPSRTKERFYSQQFSDDIDLSQALNKAREVEDDLSVMVEKLKDRLQLPLVPLEEIQSTADQTIQLLREHATSAKSVAARGNDWTSIITIIAFISLASVILYWAYKCCRDCSSKKNYPSRSEVRE